MSSLLISSILNPTSVAVLSRSSHHPSKASIVSFTQLEESIIMTQNGEYTVCFNLAVEDVCENLDAHTSMLIRPRSYELHNETDYTVPSFPSLYWPPVKPTYSLRYIYDVWRFTLTWTFIIYAIFHVSAALITLVMQAGKRPSAWKYLWTIPLLYVLAAGVEALFAGSIVGIVLGAVYSSGDLIMSTWIPFLWAWINVLVLIISSFTMQGGL
ncbi:hypothetical protein MKZ38_010351 [Zalerion maritima]|uniref:Integral membrane protein n=1 Tax=Zalerion maritima TaxID=339359 RepID=A0AAD5RYG8_9PEZI|nr:hypothetical protein MKZ38_010351 [Zalerion maritima]